MLFELNQSHTSRVLPGDELENARFTIFEDGNRRMYN